jgi:hypothetical protein
MAAAAAVKAQSEQMQTPQTLVMAVLVGNGLLEAERITQVAAAVVTIEPQPQQQGVLAGAGMAALPLAALALTGPQIKAAGVVMVLPVVRVLLLLVLPILTHQPLQQLVHRQ